MSKIVILGFLIVVFLVTYAAFPSSSIAFQKEVTGVQTVNLPQIPPTSEGPGLLLPDSPVYVFDNLKQQIRLFFAFTPRQKALVYNSIAGERLAELRFMLARNSKSGVETDLTGIAYNLQMASKMLSDEQLSGRNSTALAKLLYDSIKAKQSILTALDSQTTGEMKARVRATQEGLLSAKSIAQAVLPRPELASAEREDLVKQTGQQITDLAANVSALEQSLSELAKQASQSAISAIAIKEQAVQDAVVRGDKAAIRIAQADLVAEKVKQEKLLSEQEEAINQAETLIKTAKDTVVSYKKAQVAVEQIRSQVAGAATSSTSSAR